MANEIKITISADGTAAIEGINKVTGSMQKMETETGGIVSKIKDHWLAISATVVGAYMAIQKAWALAEKAAEYEEQKAQLNSLASAYETNANSIISDIQRITNNQISMANIVDVSAQSIARNLKPDQLKELAKYADAVGDTMKMSTAEGFRALAEGATLGRERTLEAITGIIDLNAKFGDQVNKMSEVEKANARMNIMLERLENLYPDVGKEAISMSDRMEQLRVMVEDLELQVGAGLVKALAGAVGGFYSLSSSIMAVVAARERLRAFFLTGELLVDNTKKIQEATQNANTALQMSKEYAEKGAEMLALLGASAEDLGKVRGPDKLRNNIRAVSDAAKNAAEKIRELNKSIQGMIDQATLSPIALIEKQAEEWGKAGADRVLIERWVQIETDKLRKQAEEEAKRRADEEKMRAKELALAKANIAQQEVETLIGIEQKLIDYRLNAGEISETEAIKQRYDLEMKVLESRQEQLIVQMSQETNEARFLELQGQYYNIQKQIEASREYEVYELQEAEKKNQEDILAAEQKKLELMQQQYEIAKQGLANLVGSLEGPIAEGLGMVATGLEGLIDIAMLGSAADKAYENYKKIEEAYEKHKATLLDVTNAYDAWQIAQEEYTAEAKLGIYTNMLSAMAGAMYSLYAASGEQSKTFFAMYKAFAIAQAIIDTYKTAQAGAAALAGIPYVGPSLAVAWIATSIATGLARVAVIAAQEPGGSVSSASTSTSSASTEPTTTEAAEVEEETKAPPIITVNIYSTVFDQSTLDDLARQLQTSLAKAVIDGVH